MVEHGDAVGKPERLLLIVGHDDERDARVLLRTLQLDLHLLAQPPIERRKGLVEKKHLRLLDERAGERDALALTAGELMRFAVPERAQSGDLEYLVQTRRSISGFCNRSISRP